jgi:FkbM family methyltransferase
MIRTVKRWVKTVALKMDVVIFKRSTGLFLAEHEMPNLVQRLCGKPSPLIVDGGAHRGDFVYAIRKYLPQARFVCFEPDPVLAEELQKNFGSDKAVSVIQAALGEQQGNARFNLNKARATNSLLPSADQNVGRLQELSSTEMTIDVEVTTIDASISSLGYTAIDILKLDLQGYDYLALKGAQSMLKTASVVVVEVLFTPIYTGAHSYLDICQLMHEYGYSLYALTSLHYGQSERLLWGDAIFVPVESMAWQAPVNL